MSETPRAASDAGASAFETLLANTDDIMYIVDADMTFRAASRSFADFLGVASPEDIAGRRVEELITNDQLRERHLRDDRAILESGRDLPAFLETLQDAVGKTRRLLCSKYALKDDRGEPVAVLCASRDVTAIYEKREDYLQELQYLLRVTEATLGAWLLDIDQWRVVEFRAPPTSPVIRRDTIEDYVEAVLESAEDSDEAAAFFLRFEQDHLRSLFKSGRRQVDFEYRRAMPDGRRSWVQLSLRLLMDPATGHIMAAASLCDINGAKSAHSELVKAAEVDSMTGVLNHDATLSHIQQFLTGKGAGGQHALVMVDRDGLKTINDTFGHQTGDEIIIETARVLQSVFRDTDIIGRVGGDEFMILMKNIGHPKHLRRKAAELLQSLQCICGPAENAVETTGSVGISFYKGDNKTLERLYSEADSALYKAKSEGRNRCVLFNDELIGAERADERDSLMDTINLRTLLNSIDGGILIMRTEPGGPLQPVFFSDSFLTMMGSLTQDEAFKLYGDDLLACIHPDDRERVGGEYSAAFESGDPLRTTYRLLGKNGDYYWLSAGTNITKAPDGKLDVYAVHTNIEKLMHREEKLASDEQRFRMAFSQTSRMLCEVDVAADSLALYARGGADSVPQTSITGLPESLIASGFLHESSAPAFREFYQGLKSGRPADKGLFKSRYLSTGKYGWTSFSYESVCDAVGRPVKAVASIEELPNIARAQERLEREEYLLRAVRDDQLVTLKVNLSDDSVEYFQAAESDVFSGMPADSYSAFAEAMAKVSSYAEDSMLLQLNLTRDRLADACASGKNWVSVEFRRVDGGEIRWTKVTASLMDDPVARKLYAFIYVGDAEKRRSVEALLPVSAERDQISHLHTQTTVERMVDCLMRGAGGSDKLYSLALIRITGLPALAARIGSENVELEKMYLGRFLGLQLESDCIVGHMGADSMIAFCPDSQSDDWMRQRVETAVRRVQQIRSDTLREQLKLVCGVTTEQARIAELSGMLAQASSVCDAYQNSGEDAAFTFEQYVDSFRVSQNQLDSSAFQPVSQEELSRPLFGSEREAMADCMTALLSAASYSAAVSGVLGVLGKYYGAQRVYTLALQDNNTYVTGRHEWVAPDKHSTLRQMSRMPLDKLPVFKRTLVAARPVILDNRIRRSVLRQERFMDSPWCFMSLPVISESRVQGFLCIENPEKHKFDVALPAAVIPLLTRQRARMGAESQGAGAKAAGRDPMTGLADRATFESFIQSFNADAYHAVGVLYISVINLREQNRANGVAYGDDMLVFTANTLASIIKKEQLFRMSGPEFAVISTNLSKEAFQGQCARVQSVLQRRYPKCFCFGYSWSDKNASARKLLSNAEALAHNGEDMTLIPVVKKESGGCDIKELRAALKAGRFFILLQPLVDMRTGKVVGAEALARCRTSGGTILLPASFIPVFEKGRAIRELDYHILELAFKTVEGWMEQGLRPVPVSVNFSRQTMMGTAVLASSLAIRSRFDVPDELVSIEVTDSSGERGPGTLRTAMDGMTQQGFRFALDDMGSGSSNLNDLEGLSFSDVKLDRGIVSSFPYNSLSRSVAESIVGLCAKTGVRCIAEGVESELHSKGLIEAGCVYAQGFFCGKPMPVDDFTKKYLKQREYQEERS